MSDDNNTSSNLSKLLTPIPTNDGVGDWLRYDPVYNKIRDFRREDDDGTFREPWEGELKHANWQEVERLCTEAISTKSKDLQLVLWLLEARIHLYGIPDLKNCTEFFQKYIQAFWKNTYPQIDNDPAQEFRTHLIEAFLRSICELVILEPLSELSQFFSSSITLAKCFEASNLEKNAKRGGDAADFFHKAIAKGLITMDRIRNALKEVKKENGIEKLNILEASMENLKTIDSILEQEIGNESPRFDEILNLLEELKGLYSLCQRVNEETQTDTSEQQQPQRLAEGGDNPAKDQDKNVINDRSGVYNALRQLGDFLITLEPHSPSPALIKLVASWENKTLSQILADLQTSPLEIRSFINMLARAASSEITQQVSQVAKQDSNDLSQLTAR